MSEVLLICPNALDIKIHPIFDEIEPLFLTLAEQRGLVGLARGAIVPPTELLTLSTYLIDAGISVSILDLTLEALKDNNIRDAINKKLKNEDPKIVGIRANEICFIDQYKEISSLVKNYNPDIMLIIGGVAATGYDTDLLSDKNINFIVRGEGELTFLELCTSILNNKKLNGLNGISFISNKEYIRNPDRELLDLSTLKLPTRDIYPLKELYKLNGGIDLVYTSRGCPFNCSFCNAPSFWKHKWRGRKPEDIVDELLLIQEQGAKIVHIHDVNFGVNIKWVKKICELIRDNGLELYWDCQLRVDQLKKQTLKTLYTGNCRSAFIGIESASQASLDGSNKNYSTRSLINALNRSKQDGIHIDGGYVVGLPDDNLDSLQATKNLAITLFEKDLVETPIYFLFIPWKGSHVGDNPEKFGIKIENYDVRYWHGFTAKPVASTKTVDAKTVYSFWEKGWSEIREILSKKISN